MVAGRKNVAFQAMDGVLLKGWFFPAGEEKAPCVILTCGLTALKEHFVDDFAVAFQKAGYHALLYDNRGFGASGGKRFDADPVAAQDDYFDAFDYAASLPEVDADRIAYWGTSYSGGVAMTAAAIDKRIKAVVVQAPFVSGELQLETHMQFLPSALRDRGLIRTGEEWPITGIVANSLEEAQSGQAKVVLPDTIAYQYFQDSSERGGDWQNKMTTMTLIKMLRFEPVE